MGLKRGLSQAVGAVAVVTVAGQLLNVAQEMVIAAKFGTSASTDAYKMALVIPIMLTLELTTIIGAIVIPVFHEQRTVVGAFRNIQCRTKFHWDYCVLALQQRFLCLAPFLMDAVAGGFSEETRGMATFLLRVLSLGIFFYPYIPFPVERSQCSTDILPFRHFRGCSFMAARSRFYFLSDVRMGLPQLLSGLLWAFGLFVIVQMVVVLKKMTVLIYFQPGAPCYQEYGYFRRPLIFNSLLNQLNVLIEKRIVSGFEPGSLSALDFAFKLSAFFINFLVIGINTVLFPTLSESFASGNRQRISSIFDMLMKGLAAIIVPTTMAFILLGKPLVHLVFERGSFDAHSTLLTSRALSFYAIRPNRASVRREPTSVLSGIQEKYFST